MTFTAEQHAEAMKQAEAEAALIGEQTTTIGGMLARFAEACQRQQLHPFAFMLGTMQAATDTAVASGIPKDALLELFNSSLERSLEAHAMMGKK